MATFNSALHVFSVDDLTATFSGIQFPDYPEMLDTAGAVVEPYVSHAGTILYGIDNEFGFHVTDFVGAEEKELDGDFAEGYAGNIYGEGGEIVGIAVRNAETDLFLSGAPFGTWSLGLGGSTVKASTEHYTTMQALLSDQAYPGDADAIGGLDDDLKMADLYVAGDGSLTEGPLHDFYVKETVAALQAAMDSPDPALDTVLSDVDFDRDGTLDTYRLTKTTVDFDSDGDGVPEAITVGAVDIGNDGSLDVVDSFLNGYGGEADLTDLLEPNESSVTYNIAYGQDYSVTLKDDGKLLYRWGEAVKRPNDVRMEVNIDLPEEWTVDEDGNGIADSLEDASGGFVVTKAELIVTHTITNNPNDQIRPEDYENEAAIGRLPSYYIVTDPDDPDNELWVSPVDTFNGLGDALPSYFVLDADGEIDMSVVGGTAVYNPDGVLVGYRNEDAEGNAVGTVLRDMSLVAAAAAADLDFSTADLAEGFTDSWYTSTDREPFEWSYDMYPDDPYANVFVSFRDADAAADAGYTEDSLVSGPRWRLTPNKFGQDLPGLEIPLEPNSEPPFQKDNIKYDTGELTTTTINLLDWDGDSPLANSTGWMVIDPTRLDVDADGIIDDGWSAVNGTLGAGDAMPTGLILSAVTPNGTVLEQNVFDTAIYVKGDRQDAADLYDMQLVIEYEPNVYEGTIGSVQQVSGLNHEEMTVNFLGGSFANAVVFASPLSRNGWQAATVEISEITSTSATIRVDEPDGYDDWHVAEQVSLVAFEEGVWEIGDGSVLEVGTTVFETGPTNVFQTVEFQTTFSEAPVLMLQIQTANGPEWEIARVGQVTETGFTYLIEEEEGQTNNDHGRELIGYAAIDAAAADGLIDWDGVAAQAYRTGPVVDDQPTAFTFDESLGTDPLVSGILSSYHGWDTANLRLVDMEDDGSAATAYFMASEERTLDNETEHNPEDVAGLAFEGAAVLYGETYVVDEMIFV
ncbi:hypothetical protein KUV62_16890 [Salipiger bermudensis]|uniref:hypothetical protein n=1 Tax=Salipiger bermudensis TaxID=344736 RepID=UPI001C9A2BB0|nr:hypothetical protein [Salipiger bermudensis]MBY6005603.1 hypothetical protein [Salipiger bermudensis]